MWENDYDYLQNKLNYSMGIDPVYVGKDTSVLITVDHLKILKQPSLTNDKMDMKAVFKNKVTDKVFTPPTNGWLLIKNTHKIVNKPGIKNFTVRDWAYSFTYELGTYLNGEVVDVLVNLERTPVNSWGYNYEGEGALYELNFLYRRDGNHLGRNKIEMDMIDISDLDLFYAIIVEKAKENI